MLIIEGFGVYIDTKDGEMHVKQYENESKEDFLQRIEERMYILFPPHARKIDRSSYFIEPSKIDYLIRILMQ